MYRNVACGSFVLMRAGDLPGDPEVEEPYSLDRVFEWLRELPEQIERAIVRNGTFDRPARDESEADDNHSGAPSMSPCEPKVDAGERR